MIEHGTFTDPRDGREYKTAKIGGQIWLAENLAFDILKGSWLYKRCEIPEGVHRLTGGVDVGLSEIWFVLLGWGNEGRKFVIRSEKIDRGEGSESLAIAMGHAMEMCKPSNYRVKGGAMPRFSGGLIDSGDGNDTEAVYEFCRLNKEWRPSKGRTDINPYIKPVEIDPVKYRRRYSGLMLYLVDTNFMQGVLRKCLKDKPGAPKSIQFAEDSPEAIFAHIRNQQQYEYKKNGRSAWRWGKIGDRADHLLDALMQAMFAGSIMGFHRVADFAQLAAKPQRANEIIRAGSIYGGWQK